MTTALAQRAFQPQREFVSDAFAGQCAYYEFNSAPRSKYAGNMPLLLIKDVKKPGEPGFSIAT